MKNWKGVFIIGIAALHTLFALASFGPVYIEMFGNGFINSINSPKSAIATWFFLFGILMYVLGLMIYTFEKNSISIPKGVILVLLILAILGVSVMPMSGFWLLFPPVITMLLQDLDS